jgi:hypothetical protein
VDCSHGALFSNVNLQRTTEICKVVGVKINDPASQPRHFSPIPALFGDGSR